MPASGSPGGGKPAPVEVIYFPKRPPRERSAPAREVEDAPDTSRTIEFRPEFPPDDAPSVKRGRHHTPTEELPAHDSGVPARAKKTPKPRRKLSVEIDTDPALRYHVEKLEELLKTGTSARPLQSLSRVQLAEMSLFGHQLFETGRLDEARVVFEGLVALDVEDAFPHTMLGTVYLALGKQDRAFALFEAALGIDSADLAARVYRAEIRLNRGQHKLALQELSEVISEGPAEDPFVDRARRLTELAGRGRRRR